MEKLYVSLGSNRVCIDERGTPALELRNGVTGGQRALREETDAKPCGEVVSFGFCGGDDRHYGLKPERPGLIPGGTPRYELVRQMRRTRPSSTRRYPFRARSYLGILAQRFDSSSTNRDGMQYW